MVHVALPPALSSTPQVRFSTADGQIHVPSHNLQYLPYSGVLRDRWPLPFVHKTPCLCFISTSKSETFQIPGSRPQVYPGLPAREIDHCQEVLRPEETGTHVSCFQPDRLQSPGLLLFKRRPWSPRRLIGQRQRSPPQVHVQIRAIITASLPTWCPPPPENYHRRSSVPSGQQVACRDGTTAEPWAEHVGSLGKAINGIYCEWGPLFVCFLPYPVELSLSFMHDANFVFFLYLSHCL